MLYGIIWRMPCIKRDDRVPWIVVTTGIFTTAATSKTAAFSASLASVTTAPAADHSVSAAAAVVTV